MRINKGQLLAAGAAAGLLTLAACGSPAGSAASANSAPKGHATTSSPAAASGAVVLTRSTKIGTVLTSSRGFTLYWFAPDTATTSKCTGSCATYWPPVAGPVTAGAGTSLPGKFGTITRADGSVQATYDGHPLYTYAGDTAPGMTSGNGLKASGGLWTAVTPSGGKPAPSTSSPAGSSSGPGGGGW